VNSAGIATKRSQLRENTEKSLHTIVQRDIATGTLQVYYLGQYTEGSPDEDS